MFKSRKCLAVVPARGGSKGIQNKNRRLFLGRPLIEWTIRTAIESRLCDRIVVSTDDLKTAEIAENCGGEVPFVRPSELAQDKTPTANVIRHAVDWLETEEKYFAEIILILEPTSPCRQQTHIEQAIEMLSGDYVDSVASIVKVPHHFVSGKQLNIGKTGQLFGLEGQHPMDMIHRRQDLAVAYAFSGTIFACKRQVLNRDPPSIWGKFVKGIVVEEMYSVDLDQPQQWEPSEEKLRRLLARNNHS